MADIKTWIIVRFQYAQRSKAGILTSYISKSISLKMFGDFWRLRVFPFSNPWKLFNWYLYAVNLSPKDV